MAAIQKSVTFLFCLAFAMVGNGSKCTLIFVRWSYKEIRRGGQPANLDVLMAVCSKFRLPRWWVRHEGIQNSPECLLNLIEYVAHVNVCLGKVCRPVW
jgi:hypothetical protein